LLSQLVDGCCFAFFKFFSSSHCCWLLLSLSITGTAVHHCQHSNTLQIGAMKLLQTMPCSASYTVLLQQSHLMKMLYSWWASLAG